MIYEVLLTLGIILLGFMVYMQYVKTGKVYLFQDAVNVRLSTCYSDEEVHQDTGRSLVKLRLELLSLSPYYRGFCVEEIGFLKKDNIRFRQFSPLYLTDSAHDRRARELFLLVDIRLVPEIRLNGLELYISGYLECTEQSKHAIYQKFIVFERPAILDSEEEKYLA